ncbi:hypothetical protein DHEL01_v205069 [Diaporthe helianthi]|uniref:Uncharacterized protein n=1 Tax=Diaporthe helianthi TaxID=158607 RepID=A0A2P5I1Z5_DIAHE|nr:hypothetical protein DHEL01_v205069 [Diaporthe helianthi]
MHARPDLAGGVREISVGSDTTHRSILGRCTGIQSLNYFIHKRDDDYYEFWRSWSSNPPKVPDVKFGDITLAAPELRRLSLYNFVDFRLSNTLGLYEVVAVPPDPYDMERPILFPDYVGLPENRITRLDLRRTRFCNRTLEQLLRNFRHLRDFCLTDTSTKTPLRDDDETRPVDGQDVVNLLEPLKDQLEVLELDLSGNTLRRPGVARFRRISSLEGFTALKSLTISVESIELPRFNYFTGLDIEMSAHDTVKIIQERKKKFIETTKGYLADMLPRRSLEFLHVGRYASSDTLDHAMCELGELPTLKHVRMQGCINWSLMDYKYILGDKRLPRIPVGGLCHNLERFVPVKYRGRARAVGSGSDPMTGMAIWSFFRDAGVLFNGVAQNATAKEPGTSQDLPGTTAVTVGPSVADCLGPTDEMWRHSMAELWDSGRVETPRGDDEPPSSKSFLNPLGIALSLGSHVSMGHGPAEAGRPGLGGALHMIALALISLE